MQDAIQRNGRTYSSGLFTFLGEGLRYGIIDLHDGKENDVPRR